MRCVSWWVGWVECLEKRGVCITAILLRSSLVCGWQWIRLDFYNEGHKGREDVTKEAPFIQISSFVIFVPFVVQM